MIAALQLFEAFVLATLVALPFGAVYSLGFKPGLRRRPMRSATTVVAVLALPFTLLVVLALPTPAALEAREEINERYGLELTVAEVDSLSQNSRKPGEGGPTAGAKLTVEGKTRYLVLVEEGETLVLYDGLTLQKLPEVAHD